MGGKGSRVIGRKKTVSHRWASLQEGFDGRECPEEAQGCCVMGKKWCFPQLQHPRHQIWLRISIWDASAPPRNLSITQINKPSVWGSAGKPILLAQPPPPYRCITQLMGKVAMPWALHNLGETTLLKYEILSWVVYNSVKYYWVSSTCLTAKTYLLWGLSHQWVLLNQQK